MLFYPCYLCGFQIYPSFGGGIIEVCAIRPKKWGFEARIYPNRGAFTCPCVGRIEYAPQTTLRRRARVLPLVVDRHSPSMRWRFVGRMPYAPTVLPEK